MTTGKPIKIVSMGTYLPELVSSEEIEDRYGIPKGWSKKYSGVETRHHVSHESNGFMGARAAERALEKASMSLGDVDLLISAGGTYDYPLPNQASIIKNEIKDGIKHDFPAIDIDSTCLSFVVAMDFAARMMETNGMKNVLIVSSETASKGLNKSNWETATLFGDGAAAALITIDPETSSGYVKGAQKTYSVGVYDSIIEAGGNVKYVKDNPYDEELYSFKMNGKKLLRLAKKKIPIFMNSFFKDLPMNIEDVDVIIPHQASKMGLHIFKGLFNFKEGQVKETLSIYGNCIAASIPLTLSNVIDNGELKRGDTCFLCGTSAGFAIGGVLIKY